MVRNVVLNAQAAEPAVGHVDLDLAAQHPLRADGEYVADDEHPDHDFRIDRGSARLGIVARQLPMHPRQIKDRRRKLAIYSITSSELSNSDWGIVRPSAFAVL